MSRDQSGLPSPPISTLCPISRSRAPANPAMTVEEAIDADRKFFAENPDIDEYIREFCLGEFGKAELPDISDGGAGWRYATHVSVFHRETGEAVGRYRRLMVICEDPQALGRAGDDD
jgi:hypothetical protein